VRYLTVGGLTIDDIVVADATVHRGVPGGNALYAALGAALWSHDVGILSFVGEDYPRDVLHCLEDSGVDVSHVAHLDQRSIHLWILYEADGCRQICYQHHSSSLLELSSVVTAQVPLVGTDLAADGAVHLAALPVALQRAILPDLRLLGRPVTLDSIEARGTVGGDLAEYWEHNVFLGCAAFLPSRQEFDVIRGDRDADDTAWALARRDVRCVVVKDGRRGVDVYDALARSRYHIAAYDVAVVDPTGAGDAFCGGFLVGLGETGDVREAALRGVVSASFVIEGIGAMHMLKVPRAEVDRRLQTVRAAAPSSTARWS